MTYRNSRLKGPLIAIWIVVLAGLSAWLFVKGRYASAIGFCSGSAAGVVVRLTRRARIKAIEARGDVPWDERDLRIAGKSAMFTIRVLIIVLSLGLLAVFLAAPETTVPVVPAAGVFVAVLAVVYAVSYRVMRKRDD